MTCTTVELSHATIVLPGTSQRSKAVDQESNVGDADLNCNRERHVIRDSFPESAVLLELFRVRLALLNSRLVQALGVRVGQEPINRHRRQLLTRQLLRCAGEGRK